MAEQGAGAARRGAGNSLLNLLRLVTLFCVGAVSPERAGFLHEQVWPLALVLATLLLWLGWVHRVTRPAAGSAS